MKNVLLILWAAAVCLTGCHSGGGFDLVGTWQSALGGANTTYHFRKDGTFTVENLYMGTRAVVDGKYRFEDGKLCMDPVKSDVQGQGVEADHIRSVIMQPSRVAFLQQSPISFQLGFQSPPLMVHRVSENP